MKAAELIREYLAKHPEGALVDDIHLYVAKRYNFRVADIQRQKNSISGQLVKKRERGIVISEETGGKAFLWRLRNPY